MSDLIDRQAAIKAIGEIHSLDYNAQAIKARIEQLPSAEPDIARAIATILQNEQDMRVILQNAQQERHYDEWCTDCKEYDHERHCCPRFNHVIRTTLNEAQAERKTGKWVPKADQRYYCSRCDEVAPKGIRWNFCPNCGARMEVEE